MAGKSIFELPPEEREALRRKREMIAIVVIGSVLGVLFLIETLFFDFRGSLGGGNLLFFSLINVNVILVCVLLFLILRNVTKLLFERRRKVLGAQLRTRLVVAFVLFALVPTIILFYVAMTFITNSIERWFSLQIEGSLAESLKVAQTYYETHEKRAIGHARDIAAWLLTEPEPPADDKSDAAKQLRDKLAERRQLLSVDLIEVYREPTKKPIFAGTKEAKTGKWFREDKDFLSKGFAKQEKSEVFSLGESELIRGMAPVAAPDEAARAVVVVSYYVPQSLVQRMRTIQETYDSYSQMQVMESPIRSNYLIILAMIYIFIFFSATWFGFFLARQITEPLQRLADGAQRVAAGERDVYIQKTADDELGILVDVFNRMWAELGASRKALEEANEDLEKTNIELERRRASMATVLNNIAAGVLAFDNEGRVTIFNPGAERMLGIKASAALDKSWTDVFPEEMQEYSKSLGDQLRLSQRPTVQNQIEITINNQQRTMLATLSVLRGAQSDAAGAVLVLEDLTELLKMQRVAAWQEIARRIAHEIKNPLTPIQLAAQRLRKRYADRFDEEVDKVFFDSTSTIVRQVEELKGMVKEFSDFARIAEAKPSPTNLHELIRETVVLYSEAHKRVQFETLVDDNVPHLLIDRDQFKRVLINILDNAIASIVGRGKVKISAATVDDGRWLRLEIADTGQGIPREYQSRLFEPYFSTKKMGTGLGLAIVNRIVKDHAGRIHLRDNQPQGTVVVIEIPVRTADVENETDEPDETE
ncbi:MAG TPA: ATP-binding protein [bacterium]|nr:ATP-binding protein [bacterium]